MPRNSHPSQGRLGLVTSTSQDAPRRNGELNKLLDEDRPVHQWYRFVLSFPPHLVREYVSRFQLDSRHCLLDPFCGTGTTLVECKKLGLTSVGVEANPLAHFASQVKLDWSVDPRGLVEHAQKVADYTLSELRKDGIGGESELPSTPIRSTHLRELSPEKMRLLLANSISPVPLHRTLVLLECIERFRDERYRRHELLALANALVTRIGNLHFGPEVGVGSPKADAPVVSSWLEHVGTMALDLEETNRFKQVPSVVHLGDSRDISRLVTPGSIDAVFTSPPYPNEKDYTRTTRLESVLLGFIVSKDDLRKLKAGLVRSNTRNVFKNDDDDNWIVDNNEVGRIAQTIEDRRVGMGKTSGFERLYSRVTKLYFGGMARHLSELRKVLRPGARLAYVVGDQASYLRVMIRTGHLIAEIAESLGYKLLEIDLFRTRLATATKEQLREEVVILGWPG